MDSTELTRKLSESLSNDSPLEPAGVREIQAAFQAMSRPWEDVSELVAVKYRMQHWRHEIFTRIANGLKKPSAKTRTLLQSLAELQYKPGNAELLSLIKAIRAHANEESRAELLRTLATLGEPALLTEVARGTPSPELRALAGPAKKAPIAPNDPSRWSYAKWARDPEFSRYRVQTGMEGGDTLVYRGLQLQAGDVLIANVNRDGNGVYTALQFPRGYGYHLGVFAFLSFEGRTIPAILETYRLGIRAVPVSTFLSPEFSSYIEVCRLRDRPAGFAARLNAAAAGLPEQVLGYNFDTEDPDPTYLSCTRTANVLFEKAGAAPIRTKSAYKNHPVIQRNLDVFEFGVSAFLSLTDFIAEERLTVIGSVDNGHFHRNVTRELCEREFVKIFERGELDVKYLPRMFQLNCFGVRQMRAGTLLGRLIGAPYGFTEENLPRGPVKVLAVIEIYEHLIAAAVKRAATQVEQAWEHKTLIDIDRLSSDPSIGAIFQPLLQPIARAFRNPASTGPSTEQSLLPIKECKETRGGVARIFEDSSAK